MFRNLIPLLAESYHVVAPDYLGFGDSDSPLVDEFSYTFDSITRVVRSSSRPVPERFERICRTPRSTSWMAGTFCWRPTRPRWRS